MLDSFFNTHKNPFHAKFFRKALPLLSIKLSIAQRKIMIFSLVELHLPHTSVGS